MDARDSDLVYIGAKVTRKVKRELIQLACARERTVSGELRLAVKQYLAQQRALDAGKEENERGL